LEIYLKVGLAVNQRWSLLVGVCCHYDSSILLHWTNLARCLCIQIKITGSLGGVETGVSAYKPRTLAVEFVAS